MDLTLKRVMAYLMDFLFITILVSLIVNIKFINPYLDNYRKTYDEYNELITDVNEDKLNVESSEYKTKIVELTYDLNKYRVISASISSILFLGYFGVLQYFLNGQTLGKKIMKIKIASANNKKLTILNFITRSVILNNIIFSVLLIVGVFVFSKSNYYYLSLVVSYLELLVMSLIVLMLVLRKDNRGLHDLITNTRVVSVDDKNDITIIDNPKNVEKNKKKN